MGGMWEHIDGLYFCYPIIRIQLLQVTSLCGRITGYIDDTLRSCPEDGFDNIGMHTCTWWVSDNDIGTTMFSDKHVSQDIFHITSEEQGIVDMINLGIDSGIFNRFWYIFNTNHFPCFPCDEVSNSTSASQSTPRTQTLSPRYTDGMPVLYLSDRTTSVLP